MENKKHMVRWTNEEKALLAHFIKIATSENNMSVQEGCEFAAKKLGRSAAACSWQYHNYVKHSPDIISYLVEEPETVEEDNTDKLLETISNLKAKLKKSEENQEKLLKFIDRCMDDLNFKIYVTLADTGRITQSDIKYNTELVSRMINHKLENLDENGNIL